MVLLYYCEREVSMAKAKISTDSGAIIELEGSPEEIAKIMGLYKKSGLIKEKLKTIDNVRNIHVSNKHLKYNTAKPSMTDSIKELIENGFFNKPRGLAEIKNKLEEEGVFIAITSLSERALFLIKRRELRRIRNVKTKKWEYVQR